MTTNKGEKNFKSNHWDNKTGIDYFGMPGMHYNANPVVGTVHRPLRLWLFYACAIFFFFFSLVFFAVNRAFNIRLQMLNGKERRSVK